MNVLSHVLFSLFFSLLLYPYLGWQAFLILIGGVLFDVDHYFLYIWRKGDFSLKNAYWYFKNMGLKDVDLWSDAGFVFHFVEVLLVLLILGIFYQPFFWLAIGLAFHLLLDIIHELKVYGTSKSYSLFFWILKKR